jgi:DNA-binding NarL/FixJ family response regulator
MQVRAIVRAARAVADRTGDAPLVEIMHPLVGFAEELRRLRELTDREREVAVALGRGASNAEIGAELFTSVPTVEAHVSRVLQKLDCNDRVQIALLAHDAGLV